MSATRHPIQVTPAGRAGRPQTKANKPSVRETKCAETREKIVKAAFELFQARGYDDTTVDDIVALAGVGKRTFFRHFPSKIEVTFPYERQRLERFAQLLEEHFDLDNPVHGVARALFALLPEYQSARDMILMERTLHLGAGSWEWMARNSENERVWRDLISQALGRGHLTAIEARVLAAAIYAAAEEVMDLWFSMGCQRDVIDCVGPIAGVLAWIAERYDHERVARYPQAFLDRVASPSLRGRQGETTK
jgi:AcrR family transcriptional regulator